VHGEGINKAPNCGRKCYPGVGPQLLKREDVRLIGGDTWGKYSTDISFPQPEVRYYAEAVRRGGALVSKQARVAEEVVIGKEVAERTETVRDTVRRIEVEVEQLGKALARDRRYGKSDWDAVEPEARRRWEESHPGAWEDFKDALRSAWNKLRGR
jgi:Domain of unknown function (DUF2382)